MKSALDQFVEDYTLVIDNDQDAYNEAREAVAGHVWASNAGDELRDQYEDAIASALDVLRESDQVAEVTVNLMAQLLQHWGSDAFTRIAKHYMDKE